MQSAWKKTAVKLSLEFLIRDKLLQVWEEDEDEKEEEWNFYFLGIDLVFSPGLSI